MTWERHERHSVLFQLFLGTLCSIVILATSVFAEMQSITLKLSADKSVYVLGEPVYVTAQLHNTGTDPVKAPTRLSPKLGEIYITIVPPDGKQFGFVPLAIMDTDEQHTELLPGAMVASVIPIFYSARGWTFSEPGDYYLRAIYQSEGDTNESIVASDKVKVTISDTDMGPGQFLIKDEKASDEAGKFLLWQSGDHLRRGIAHLQNMVDRYPKTSLADYVWLAIGRNLSREFKDYSANRLRPPNYGEAMKYLKKVNEKKLPKHLVVRKRLAEAKVQIGLGNKATAREILEKTKQMIGNTPELQEYINQLK